MASILNLLAGKKVGLTAKLTADSVAGFIIVLALVAIPVIAFSSSLLLQLQAAAQDPPKPAQLAEPTVTSGNKSLTVDWTAPSSNAASTTAYSIRHIESTSADKSDPNWTVLDKVWTHARDIGRALRHPIQNLTNGTEYDVQVRAENQTALGDWSPTANGTPATYPGPLTNIKIVPGNQQLTVSWDPPKNNGGSPITEYRLRYRKDGKRTPENPYLPSHDGVGVAVTSLSYTITGLTNGQGYTVHIGAVNSVGWKIADENITYGNTPSTSPGPLTNIKIVPGNQQLTVSWDPPDDDGGSPITEYRLRYRKDRKHGTVTPYLPSHDGVAVTSPYTIEGLTNGQGYTLHIGAVNRAGWKIDDKNITYGNTPVSVVVSPGITVPSKLEVDEGKTKIYFVQLKNRPSGTVWLNITSSDSGDVDLRVSSRGTFHKSVRLQFSRGDWNTPKSITLRGRSDRGSADDQVTISHEASGGGYDGIIEKMEVTVDDDDWDRDPPRRQARIYRIEPEVESITLRAGERVRLEANVYSVRGGIDNSLGNTVTFRWSDGRASGTFSKVNRNAGTDEREIIYTAPDDAGRYTVEASLSAGTYSECSGSRSQCTAEFRIRVLKSRAAPTVPPTSTPKPVNPSIKIPTMIVDSNGAAYLTFTPADVGEFKSTNFSFSAPSGAIPSGELIGVRMAETLNDAGQVKVNTDRYLLSGAVYTVSAVSRTGKAYEQYQLSKPGTACIPLPERFLGNVGNIYMVKIQPNGSIVVLSSKIMVADRGFEVCGNFSWLPGHLAVGKRSPIVSASTPVPTAIAPTPEVSPAPLLPVTGGAQPPSQTLTTIFLLMGGAAILLGVLITATRAKKRQGAVRVAHKPRSQTQSRQR